MRDIIRAVFSGLPLWQKALTLIALALYVAWALVYLIVEKLSMRRAP